MCIRISSGLWLLLCRLYFIGYHLYLPRVYGVSGIHLLGVLIQMAPAMKSMLQLLDSVRRSRYGQDIRDDSFPVQLKSLSKNG